MLHAMETSQLTNGQDK